MFEESNPTPKPKERESAQKRWDKLRKSPLMGHEYILILRVALEMLVLVIALGISVWFFFLLLVDRAAALDLIQAIITWPVVIAIALLLLYKPLSRFLDALGQNFQTVKIAVLQFALEVSRASQFIPTWADSDLDLLRAAAADTMMSGKRSLFEQFEEDKLLDYVLIDIGNGDQWLTSRLFIFAIMLERMRGVQCLVFVETTSDVGQRFLGTASSSEIRWTLASLYPWLEAALARSLSMLAPNLHVVSVHGAMERGQAETLVREFLQDPDIQSPVSLVLSPLSF